MRRSSRRPSRKGELPKRELESITNEKSILSCGTHRSTSESDTQSASQSDTQSASQSDTQSASQSDTQSASQSDTQSASQSDTQSASQSDTQSASQSDTQSASQSDTQSASQSDTQSASQSCKSNFHRKRKRKSPFNDIGDIELFELRLRDTRRDYLRLIADLLDEKTGWTPLMFKDQTLQAINSYRRAKDLAPVSEHNLRKSSQLLTKQGALIHESFPRVGGTKFKLNPDFVTYLEENKIDL